MYYLSVYIKSFKELFLYLLRVILDFSKASAKVLTISETAKCFKQKLSFLSSF
ncbi:transcriptional regulator [Prevotella copri]|nr:transcriptional regulator [Segatella copri]